MTWNCLHQKCSLSCRPNQMMKGIPHIWWLNLKWGQPFANEAFVSSEVSRKGSNRKTRAFPALRFFKWISDLSNVGKGFRVPAWKRSRVMKIATRIGCSRCPRNQQVEDYNRAQQGDGFIARKNEKITGKKLIRIRPWNLLSQWKQRHVLYGMSKEQRLWHM
jgi:hypothetical protein